MHVFVYGTLTDPDRASGVLENLDYRGCARLRGLHRVEGTYPTLAPGGSVDGRVLATDDVTALDQYEGVDHGLYVRVSVPTADDAAGREWAARADGTVETYVGDPERLDAPVDWPGDGPFPERLRSYVRENDVALHPLERSSFEDFDGYDGDAVTDASTNHDAWGIE